MMNLFTPHVKLDLAYFIPFFLGLVIYWLKRAGMSVRSAMNPIKSRGAWFRANWDVLLYRLPFDTGIFYIWRHYSLAQIIAWAGITQKINFEIPSTLFAAWVLGIAADALLDWYSQSSIPPAVVRNWIREQIPNLPANGAPKP